MDECLSFTFFAPTSEAIAGSEWPEMKKNDSLLIGSILYHLVPFHVSLRETFVSSTNVVSFRAICVYPIS